MRSVVEPDNVQADPADIWQDIYRAAVGRAAHGEGFLAQEDAPLLPPSFLQAESALPPSMPSMTSLWSSTASLHDGESQNYERTESLRSLAWRQRKDHRYCQLPPVNKSSDGEEARPQVMMRLVPPKVPPSVIRPS